MRRLPLRLAPLLLLAIGCVDNRPSTGDCTGTINGLAISEKIVAAESSFWRDDDILGDEDGPLQMRYARIAVDAQFDDMPSDRDKGTYLITDPRLDHWYTTVDGDIALTATLTVTKAERQRLVGSFVFATPPEDAPGSVTCTFDLRRAFEKDTDD